MIEYVPLSVDPNGFQNKGFKDFGRNKMILGGVLFVAITVGIFWYLFHYIEPGEDIPTFDNLRWIYLVLALPFLPIETLLSSFRMWMICRVLQPEITFGSCLLADLANSGIAVLTPSQTGGGPGQIYILNRRGAKLGTALTISLLTFVGTMIALFGMGMYVLFLTDEDRSGPLFIGAVVTLTLIAALMLLSVVFPGFFRILISGFSRMTWRLGGQKYPLKEWRERERPETHSPADPMGPWAIWLVEILYTYRDDLRRFLRHGKLVFTCTCLLSLGFFFSRFILSFLCVRFLGIDESSLGEIMAIQMTLIFLTYLAPTPGSAGIAELASLSIMSGIVPHGYAPYYNILWRFATVYLVAIVGLLAFLSTVLNDMGNVYRQRWKEKI
jgi:glycosyltransferase 2 family protein